MGSKVFNYSSDGEDENTLPIMIDIDNAQEKVTTLLGPTEERQALMLEQSIAFQESLNGDRQKRIQQNMWLLNIHTRREFSSVELPELSLSPIQIL